MTQNPLLSFDTLPAFTEIAAEHVEPAVLAVLERNYAELDRIVNTNTNLSCPDWLSLMEPLDEMEDRLGKVWTTVSHLNAVQNTPDIRAAYNTCQPRITEYYTKLGQNQALCEAVKRLSARAEELALSASQRKVIKDYLLEFRLAGVDLNEQAKQHFAQVEAGLSKLSNTFSNNVLDATMAWSRHVKSLDELSGVPAMTCQSAAELAARKDLEGYVLTLDAPCYIAVMTNADNRDLRREMYTAYVTRASDQGDHDGKYDNAKNIDEILSARAELAQILGFNSFAAISVARKMAQSVNRVNDFLKDLSDLAVPAARREYAELCGFARDEYGLDALEAWDVPYFSEKLRKRNFDITQEELRPYFPLRKVQQGLFEIAHRLYGVEIEKNTSMSTWSPDVEAFDIRRGPDLLARFYFDLYTREGKRSGAWMAECRSRRQLPDGSLQIPVAYLICNFSRGNEKTPALLAHNEVTTLFHEFGHGLHHMLTGETHLRCSGINGVAWDAVELPSQLMENWCWDEQAIGMISSHYETGEKLPEPMLRKLLAAKNFQAGMKTVRQLEFAMFDFKLHQISGPCESPYVTGAMREVRALTSVYEVPEFNRFQNSFSHIFAGGYAAGYYSYKWAEVLSADVFSKFAEAGVLDAETGRRFLDKVLSRGGGAEPLALFVDFMGREPRIESLLRQDGLMR